MSNVRGFALVVALVVTALVTALLVTFINEVYLETGAHHNAVAAQQGSLFAEGGVTGGLQLLALATSSQAYTSLNDAWAKPVVLDEERGTLKITIEDETGKLNLNLVALPNGEYNEIYRGMATRLLNRMKVQGNDLVDALADWIDTGDTPHPGGAEAPWYLARKQPYRPRNKPLETFDELNRIKGFTPEIVERLRPLTTVYADQPGAPAAPININTAPRDVLLALDEQMTESLVDQIIATRQNGPFKNPAELSRVPGMGTIATALQTRIVTKGSVYRIRSEATVNEVTRTIEAVARVNGGTSTIIYWREY